MHGKILCGGVVTLVIGGFVGGFSVLGVSDTNSRNNRNKFLNNCIKPFQNLAQDNGIDFHVGKYDTRVQDADVWCGHGARNIRPGLYPADLQVKCYDNTAYSQALETAQNLTSPNAGDLQLPCRITVTLNNKRPVTFDPNAPASNSTKSA